jgi:hypothetical protein
LSNIKLTAGIQKIQKIQSHQLIAKSKTECDIFNPSLSPGLAFQKVHYNRLLDIDVDTKQVNCQIQ